MDHESGYEERWYGKLGETVQERKWVHLPGSLWHSGQKHNQGTTQYEFDTFGRLQSMVFPRKNRVREQLFLIYLEANIPIYFSALLTRR